MNVGLRSHHSASLRVATSDERRREIIASLISYAEQGQWTIVIGAAMCLRDMDEAARKAARRKKR